MSSVDSSRLAKKFLVFGVKPSTDDPSNPDSNHGTVFCWNVYGDFAEAVSQAEAANHDSAYSDMSFGVLEYHEVSRAL